LKLKGGFTINKEILNGEKVTKTDGATMIAKSVGKKSVVQSYLRAWAALGACTVTLVAIIFKSFLPHAPDYTMGFAPTWVTAFAAILGVIALLLSIGWPRVRIMPRLIVLIGAWGACILLVWSSAGIVFDSLRTAAVLGIPGLPPVVDWPGFATRTVSLIGATLLALTTVTFQRVSRGACVVCGHGSLNKGKIRSNVWIGYTAFMLSFPYPLLKIYWSLGGTLGGGQNFGHHSAYGEVLVFGASALLSLALVQRWGRIFPRWVPFFSGKKVPRWILITGGWIATCMTAPMGFLAIFGSVMQGLGLADGPVRFDGNGLMVSIVYGGWMLLGIALGGATWVYQQQTRSSCAQCGR